MLEWRIKIEQVRVDISSVNTRYHGAGGIASNFRVRLEGEDLFAVADNGVREFADVCMWSIQLLDLERVKYDLADADPKFLKRIGAKFNRDASNGEIEITEQPAESYAHLSLQDRIFSVSIFLSRGEHDVFGAQLQTYLMAPQPKSVFISGSQPTHPTRPEFLNGKSCFASVTRWTGLTGISFEYGPNPNWFDGNRYGNARTDPAFQQRSNRSSWFTSLLRVLLARLG